MRLTPLLLSLACLPATDEAFSASGEAITAMDFPAERIEDGHAKAEIVLERASVPPGGTVWIGVRFKIEEGWHLYWNGRNDTGSPPSFSVDLPAGYTLGDWRWPAPKRHVAPGDILDHVYEDSVLLMAPLTVPREAKDGSKVTVKVSADWLVCDSNLCVAESGSVETELSVSSSKGGQDSPAFATARATHPKPWPSDSKGFTTTVSAKGTKATATIHAAGATCVEFYPSANCPEVENLLRKGSVKGDTLLLTAVAGGDPPPTEISGVVGVGRDGQPVSEFYTVRLALPKVAK